MANMIDLDSFRKLSYYSNFETRCSNVLELMEGIFVPPPINPVNVEPSIVNENWPRFVIISDVNFTVNSPLVPCILCSVDVKLTGVLQLFCDHPNLTWDHVNNIPSRPLTNITKGPQYAVKLNFVNSIQADMNFSHCLSPYCFLDQIVTSCMGLLIKGPWFTFAHTEIGGGASFALLYKGIKIWCASTSSTGTRFFKRCCLSSEGFIELMQRGPRERESRYLQFTLQRPGDLIYIPHLAHAVLTLDTDSQTILSGWDAATTSNQQVILQTLDEYTFGVRRGKWREIFRKNGLSALREWVFSPSTGPRKGRNRLQNHWNYWEHRSLNLLSSWHIKKAVPRKIKSNRVPPVQSSELRYTRKDALGPGPSS